MADAHLSVSFAGPLVTFQDGGRHGLMRYGVSASGPMDRLAFDAAHAALGNPAGGTGIEVSLGGLMLACTQGDVTVAVTGGDFATVHNAAKGRSWQVLTLKQGDKLTVRAGPGGSWAYVAFAGTLQAAEWLGHSATHAGSGLGGGALRAAQVLRVSDAAVRADREGEVERPPLQGDTAARVVIGPQDTCFDAAAAEVFTTQPYTVSDAYDRMGMRLKGPELPLKGALSIPSEPIVRGSVQVSGDGVPTVLLADHQTTGGYPKIATVISPDLDRLVQYRAGQPLRFQAISAAQAVVIARESAHQRHVYLDCISIARGTLEQRLMRENLNHGVVFE